MDKRTEETINRYIRYKTGPERLGVGLFLSFLVGGALLVFGAYLIGVISRALENGSIR